MPTYDYKCNACQTVSEIRHGINEEPKTICPACGEKSLQRLIGTPGWVLKGTGWAKDGYANKLR